MNSQTFTRKLDNFRNELRCTAPDMSYREKAEEIGIGLASLFRILNGGVPSLPNYIACLEWLEGYHNEQN